MGFSDLFSLVLGWFGGTGVAGGDVEVPVGGTPKFVCFQNESLVCTQMTEDLLEMC